LIRIQVVEIDLDLVERHSQRNRMLHRVGTLRQRAGTLEQGLGEFVAHGQLPLPSNYARFTVASQAGNHRGILT
jgi:hypothetical protein